MLGVASIITPFRKSISHIKITLTILKYLFYFKGWCGWKGADFWNQQVHYNMCMPQRPDMI